MRGMSSKAASRARWWLADVCLLELRSDHFSVETTSLDNTFRLHCTPISQLRAVTRALKKKKKNARSSSSSWTGRARALRNFFISMEIKNGARALALSRSPLGTGTASGRSEARPSTDSDQLRSPTPKGAWLACLLYWLSFTRSKLNWREAARPADLGAWLPPSLVVLVWMAALVALLWWPPSPPCHLAGRLRKTQTKGSHLERRHGTANRTASLRVRGRRWSQWDRKTGKPSPKLSIIQQSISSFS